MSDIIMSTDSKSDAQWNLADALSEDILNTPAEDLLAEVAADHGDRQALANEFERISRRALRRVRRQEYVERLKQFINFLRATPRFAIITIGVLAVIVVASALRDLPFRSAEKESTTTIVAAAKQLSFGEPLTDNSVREIPWAAKVVPEGSFSSRQALLKDGKRIALATIHPNEPILSSKITGPGQRASLSTLLETDLRAITVRVEDVRGVAGFILPNDRVDVVLIRASSSGGRQSELLLQDIKVIAIDQIASQQKDNPVVARAVTLEVTPTQAQKILLATNVGSLSTILRRLGDGSVAAKGRVTEADLGEPERKAQTPQISAAPVPTDTTTTIIRNLKGTEYRVVPSTE
jgi:pilus assembly protein CpaB